MLSLSLKVVLSWLAHGHGTQAQSLAFNRSPVKKYTSYIFACVEKEAYQDPLK